MLYQSEKYDHYDETLRYKGYIQFWIHQQFCILTFNIKDFGNMERVPPMFETMYLG